jgi:hypothetical protein
MSARLLRIPRARPAIPPASSTRIGEAVLENADRAAYQSARTKDGHLAPLPLTLAEALAEAFPSPTSPNRRH